MRLRRLFAQKMRLSLQDGLHMTILQHEGAWPEGMTPHRLDALMPLRMEATLTDVEVWGAKERAEARGLPEELYLGAELLVAVAKSPEVWSAHKKLCDLGFSHVFSDFKPHVTLAKGKAGAFPPGMLATIRGAALKGGLPVDLAGWEFSPSSGVSF